VTDRLSVAGGANVRVFGVQTAPLDPGVGAKYSPYPNYLPSQEVFPTNGHPFDEGVNLSGRYRTGETTLGLHGSGNWGEEGDRAGADVYGQHVFELRYVAGVRAGVWQWTDKLQPDRDTTSFQYVLTGGYRFARGAQGTIEWEHDINGLVGQRFRVLLMLTLAVGK
jgi:hypothetical protein